MSTSYFQQFKTGNWVPPIPPALTDPIWAAQFETAGLEEKTNIINGWLWLLNKSYQGADSDTVIKKALIDIIHDHYVWLGKSLPFATPLLLQGERFDGSLSSLFKYVTGIPKESRDHFMSILAELWFGIGESRKSGVHEAARLIDAFQKFHGYIPTLHNLVQNLAWDVALEYKDDTRLKASAARLSVLHGKSMLPAPQHASLENKAWHCLAKMNSFTNSNPRDAFGFDAYSVIKSSHPIVVASNICELITAAKDSATGGNTYKFKQGLTHVVDKPIEDVTHYDVLRAWIPTKTIELTTMEAMGLSYREACERIIEQDACVTTEQVDIPEDLA